MHEDELRAIIRDAVARHLGQMSDADGRARRAGPTSLGGGDRQAVADGRPVVPTRPSFLEVPPLARPFRVPRTHRSRCAVRGRAAGALSPLRVLPVVRQLTVPVTPMSTSSRPRVFVSRRLFPETLDLIAQHADMDVFDGSGGPSPEVLVARTKGCAGLIAQGTDRIDAAFLDQLPDLRVVCNVAVGYNNIDVAAARARKVVVTNTPDVLNEACAVLTWGLILGVTRRLGEGERILRAGQWKGFQLDFLLGVDLVGKTLGVIGMGRIGQAVAAKAAAFGMRTVYMTSPRRPDEQILGPDGDGVRGPVARGRAARARTSSRSTCRCRRKRIT